MKTRILSTRVLALTAGLFAALTPVPASAGAGDFILVNGTGANITALSIRRFGTEAWRSLGPTPPAGARGPITFNDPDCAFDIQATLAGGSTALWTGLNLCEVKVVTLNRNAAGAVWVDYD